MNTESIMALALEMSGLSEIPTDSGIWLPGDNIRRVLLGIDVTSAELHIASQKGFDLAIAHHPPEATLRAWRCYLRHVEMMVAAGVPRDVAAATVADDVEGMQMRAHARIDDHTISVARWLGMPFMNIHTPLDEVGRQRMQDLMDDLGRRAPNATLADAVTALNEFPEVRQAPLPPFIAVGRPDQPAGRVVVAHGALDIPNYAMLMAYFEHGVDTVLVLRIDQRDMIRLKKEGRGSVVVVGHKAGDNIGILPFLSALRQKGLEVFTISGIMQE
jgi:hypothetical protein